MVTLDNAENALKSVYLSTVADLLNTKVNPLLTKIKQTSSDVWGNEIRKPAKCGINGGIGAGDETGNLPAANSTKYINLVSTLKNLYGQIEISDKAIRASAGGKGEFTDLLTSELEDLLKASKFNLGRMLYGNGSGKLCTVQDPNLFIMDTVKNVIEGIVVDVYNNSGQLIKSGGRINFVDRTKKSISFEEFFAVLTNCTMYVQGSKDKEITGLGAIFDNTSLYGYNKSSNTYLRPLAVTNAGSINDRMIQEVVDRLELNSGADVDMITCSTDVKYAYQDYLSEFRRNIDIMELAGGFKTISFGGIPIVSDRFVDPGTMFLLNTSAFKLHQLCDWRFLESESGKILRQTQGKATYSATLVKYCDLICDQPSGQARITGITA